VGKHGPASLSLALLTCSSLALNNLVVLGVIGTLLLSALLVRPRHAFRKRQRLFCNIQTHVGYVGVQNQVQPFQAQIRLFFFKKKNQKNRSYIWFKVFQHEKRN